MIKLIEYFEPNLTEPSDYDNASPNFTNAYICASISELCYKSSVDAEHTDQDYKAKVISKLEQWGWTSEDAEKTIVIDSREIEDEDGDTVPGTQGLIVFYKDIVFIGFRGSEKKFNDWFTNFKFLKKKSPYSKGQVHKGFLKAFNAIIPEGGNAEDSFKKILEQIRSAKSIWLTGHSLGGALASIAASYLLHSGISLSGIYTFGAPRVGEAEYRDDLNGKLTYKYWRFLNGNDLVPDLPFPGILGLPLNFLPLGFSREGFMLRLTEQEPQLLRTVYKDGTRKIWDHYDGTNAKDHSMGYYRERLLKLAGKEKNLEPEQLKMELETEIYLNDQEIEEIEKSKPLSR